MEMISYVGAAIAVILYFVGTGILLGMFKGRFRKGGTAGQPPEADTQPRQITDPGVRDGIEKLLQRHRIEGDFEVRDGKVFLTIPPDRLHPVAAMLGNAAAHVARQRNPNSITIYYRDAMSDHFRVMPDIDFDVLREAAQIMRRVAADRDLSTRLYEGLTKEEKRSMARSILATHWQRRGVPNKAFEHRGGIHDSSPQHRLVVEVIDALYEIKGVKPQ